MKTSFRPETDGFTFVNNWNYDNTEKATIKDALAGVSTGLAAALAPIYAPVLGLAAASVSPLDVFVSFLSGGLIPPGVTTAAAAITTAKTKLEPILKDMLDKFFAGTYGLCGGMASASLDYCRLHQVIPQGVWPNTINGAFFNVPQRDNPQGSALRQFIWKRLINTFVTGGAAATTLKYMFILKHIPENLGGGAPALLAATKAEWAKLKHLIDTVGPWPIGIVGTTDNPSHNHQILAYGYEDFGNSTGSLYVYDNNFPDREVIIGLDFRQKSLVARENSYVSGHDDARGPLQAFFCENYVADNSAPTTPGFPRVSCALNSKGDLHVCAIDQNRGLWHSIREANGNWSIAFEDVQSHTRKVGRDIGRTPYVACATSSQGDLHVCAIDENGGLWHTIRRPDGTWPFGFGDVQAETRRVGPSLGPTSFVACATSQQGDLHVCVIDRKGELWHTMRLANGSWPSAFVNIGREISQVQLDAGIGSASAVACAVDPQGDLHLCIFSGGRSLLHTIRRANGSYPFAYEPVPNQPACCRRVSCSVDGQGILHVCTRDENGALFHTVRLPNGKWPGIGIVQDATVGRRIGPAPNFACAANAAGELHVCAVDNNASIWHTIRRADGTWPYAFVDVREAIAAYLRSSTFVTTRHR